MNDPETLAIVVSALLVSVVEGWVEPGAGGPGAEVLRGKGQGGLRVPGAPQQAGQVGPPGRARAHAAVPSTRGKG